METHHCHWICGTDICAMTYPSEPMDMFPHLASFDISKVMKSQWNAIDIGFITLSALWFPFNPQPLNIFRLPDICESLVTCIVVSGSPVAPSYWKVTQDKHQVLLILSSKEMQSTEVKLCFLFPESV